MNHEPRLDRRRWLGLAALAPVSALLAASTSSTGCSVVSGEHDTETEFPVIPNGSGTFFGWSEITISQDVSSVEGARLQFVVLEVLEPAGIPDLTFLKNVKGEAVTPDERTTVVEKTKMPKNEPSVPLDLVYRGDLRPFFPDNHTIRIEWTGAVDLAYPFPSGGITVRVALRVVVD